MTDRNDSQAWALSPEAKELWDSINEYVITCGGDPAKHVYGNTARMNAVVRVENVVQALRTRAEKAERLLARVHTQLIADKRGSTALMMLLEEVGAVVSLFGVERPTYEALHATCERLRGEAEASRVAMEAIARDAAADRLREAKEAGLPVTRVMRANALVRRMFATPDPMQAQERVGSLYLAHQNVLSAARAVEANEPEDDAITALLIAAAWHIADGLTKKG